MKQYKIINAYTVTEELGKQEDLPITVKWALYMLRKTLYPHFEFYTTESKKLFESFNTTVNENIITFTPPEDAKVYQEKQKEIDEMEVEFSIDKLIINLSDIPKITVQQIEALDEFIEFKLE